MVEIIEDFYREHFDQYVLRITRQAGSPENAEDIIQTAFERALRYQDSFNPDINDFQTWFNKIVKRAVLDVKREEVRMGMVIESEDAIKEEEVAFDPPDPEERQWIQDEINSVTNINHRNILFLHFCRDYKPSEILKVVDESYHNINQVLKRFKQEIVQRYGTVQDNASNIPRQLRRG